MIFFFPGGGAPIPPGFIRSLLIVGFGFVLWNWSHLAVFILATIVIILVIGALFWKWWDTPRSGGSFHVSKDGRLVMGDTRSPRQAYRARHQEKVT